MLTYQKEQEVDEFSAANLPDSEAASLVIAIAWSGTIVTVAMFWLTIFYVIA